MTERQLTSRRRAVLASSLVTVAVVVGVLVVGTIVQPGRRPADPATGTAGSTGPASTGGPDSADPTAAGAAATVPTGGSAPRLADPAEAALALQAVAPGVLHDHGLAAAATPWRATAQPPEASACYRLPATPERPNPEVCLSVRHDGERLDPARNTAPWLGFARRHPTTETVRPDGSILRGYEGYDVGSGVQYLNVLAAVHLRTDGAVVTAFTTTIGQPGAQRPAFPLPLEVLVALASDARLSF